MIGRKMVMFNEKSSIWIKIYKTITLIIFWLYVLAGVVMFLMGLDGSLWWIDGGIIDGIIGLAGSFIAGYITLVVNMLIIQFLNNVQLIREKLENS